VEKYLPITPPTTVPIITYTKANTIASFNILYTILYYTILYYTILYYTILYYIIYYSLIKSRIKKERITDMSQLNYDKMRELLRKLGLNKYFEHRFITSDTKI
jgi:hypothetical protein